MFYSYENSYSYLFVYEYVWMPEVVLRVICDTLISKNLSITTFWCLFRFQHNIMNWKRFCLNLCKMPFDVRHSFLLFKAYCDLILWQQACLNRTFKHSCEKNSKEYLIHTRTYRTLMKYRFYSSTMTAIILEYYKVL